MKSLQIRESWNILSILRLYSRFVRTSWPSGFNVGTIAWNNCSDIESGVSWSSVDMLRVRTTIIFQPDFDLPLFLRSGLSHQQEWYFSFKRPIFLSVFLGVYVSLHLQYLVFGMVLDQLVKKGPWVLPASWPELRDPAVLSMYQQHLPTKQY